VWQLIGDCAPRLIGLSRTENEKQFLLGRFDLDTSFVAVGVVADHLKAHLGGPELQGGGLVCDRNDDFAHAGDHGCTPIAERAFDSDISILGISIGDCIVFSLGLTSGFATLTTAGLEALLAV